MSDRKKGQQHIVLTSHPGTSATRPRPLVWSHAEPQQRGSVMATLSDARQRHAIGTHAGTSAIYRTVAVASGALHPEHRLDFTPTAPVTAIGPHPSWSQPDALVSLDSFGAVVCQALADFSAQGDDDIRSSMAITLAHIQLPRSWPNPSGAASRDNETGRDKEWAQ